MITHLRKKDDSNKSYLYAYTEALAMQSDMIPCDSRGNPVGAAGDIVGGGMRPREAEKQSAELAIALESIETLKAEIAAIKEAVVEPIVEKVKDKEVTDQVGEMNRDDLYLFLKEKHGKKAGHLKANMSKKDLLEEAEKLRAFADINAD